MKVFVNEPLLDGKELEYITDCVKTAWISSAGEYIDRFEESWAKVCGRRFGISVANGTVALQLALACLDLQEGDEVILPSFTIISCAQAVVYNGAKPVLVDCDPETWCMDVDQVAAKITDKTRAIMPVHIYGHPVDMDPLLALAEKHNLAVIEDAAEAHGAQVLLGRDTDSPYWATCGSMGAASCFSFYANKLVTTGEGGMVVTDDERIAESARKKRNLCFESGRRFVHNDLGFNFRMTNMQAALGLAQVERFDRIVEKKRWMGRRYTKLLDGHPMLQLPVEKPWARSVYWMYGTVLSEDSGMNATEFASRLKALGVDTRPFFAGMHNQPVLQKMGLFAGEQYPVTDRIEQQGLYLPSGLTLTEEQIQFVCDAVKEVLS